MTRTRRVVGISGISSSHKLRKSNTNGCQWCIKKNKKNIRSSLLEKRRTLPTACIQHSLRSCIHHDRANVRKLRHNCFSISNYRKRRHHFPGLLGILKKEKDGLLHKSMTTRETTNRQNILHSTVAQGDRKHKTES